MSILCVRPARGALLDVYFCTSRLRVSRRCTSGSPSSAAFSTKRDLHDGALAEEKGDTDKAVIARLLHPMGLGHFMSAYFGQDWALAPHSSGDERSRETARWVASCLTLRDMVALLSQQGQGNSSSSRAGSSLRFSSRENSSGSNIDSSMVSASHVLGSHDTTPLADAQWAFASGSSVCLSDLQRGYGRVPDVAAAVARSLGIPVRADARLEPPSASTALHRACWQPWPRLILQTHGEKTWHLSGRRNWAGLQEGRTYGSEAVVDGGIPVTLRAGDVLFVPSCLALQAEPATDELSLHVTLHIEQHRFTWAALLSLICRHVLLSSLPEWDMTVDREGRHPVAPDGLDDALLQEAARVPTLDRSCTAPLDDGLDDPFGTCLPVVLQRAVCVPEDLPHAWEERLLRQLRRLVTDLQDLGHLDRNVCMSVETPDERNGVDGVDNVSPSLVADELALRAIVDAVGNASAEVLARATTWALAEMRYRGAVGLRGQDCAGESFSSLSRALCARALHADDGEVGNGKSENAEMENGHGFDTITFVRSQASLPFIRPCNGETQAWELWTGAARFRIASDLVPPAAWCLGAWTGSIGRPFRLSSVPGDRTAARAAAAFLLRAGALEVYK